MAKRGKIQKVLIANRGEIAVRIIRTLRELGIQTVAVYSQADKTSLHVRMADESYEIGPPPSRESYLHIEKILDVAKKARVDAIHPGYGFLSENPEFARAVTDEGLIFIGPPPHAIEAMGDKTVARNTVRKRGVPLVPGTLDPVSSPEEGKKIAEEIGFPVLIKASAGGGGKGMRKVDTPEEFPFHFASAKREALSAFGDDRVYIEKYISAPRHIEVQVFGDQYGNLIHLGERECSIQRRHQKIIEEAPSPFISEETRRKMGEAAVEAAKSVGYFSAGTVEFVVGPDENFYFLEMNTRIQVEHPVTEMVTGLDLITLQILVAEGEKLPYSQEEIQRNGWAVEVRVYAEDPEENFRPSPGKLIVFEPPSGPWIRNDIGVYEGFEIPPYYDPMIGKLIAWGNNRKIAIMRLIRALKEYKILGIRHNIPFLIQVLSHPEFQAGNFDTHFLEKYPFQKKEEKPPSLWVMGVASALKKKFSQENSLFSPGDKAPSSPWKIWGRKMMLREFSR
jgi:acetyl-CoA carboxylase biotin carboxylase subunit